jgi:glycosyltransferase involved in cell wall biosynthesis
VRIALVIDSIQRGGAERQALYCARGLAQLGNDVELVYYTRSPLDYDRALAGGAELTCLPKQGRPLRFVLRLRTHLARGRFDVVHSFKSTPCLYGGVAAWLARVPVIVGSYRGGRYVESGATRLGHRLLARVQTAWVENSPGVVDELVRAVGVDRRRCHVVRNAIDPAAFRSDLDPAQARARLGLEHDCETVTMLANLRPEKNHALFLEAAVHVASARPRVRFLLAGEGPERPSIEAAVARLGLVERVHLLGMRDDVPDVLAATDVTVLTSDYEGFSNTQMESLAAGVPVVTTHWNGVEELVRDGREGFVVAPGDAPALAARITSLLADPALRRRLGASGRERVESRFGLDATVSTLLALYERLWGECAAAIRSPR